MPQQSSFAALLGSLLHRVASLEGQMGLHPMRVPSSIGGCPSTHLSAHDAEPILSALVDRRFELLVDDFKRALVLGQKENQSVLAKAVAAAQQHLGDQVERHVREHVDFRMQAVHGMLGNMCTAEAKLEAKLEEIETACRVLAEANATSKVQKPALADTGMDTKNISSKDLEPVVRPPVDRRIELLLEDGKRCSQDPCPLSGETPDLHRDIERKGHDREGPRLELGLRADFSA